LNRRKEIKSYRLGGLGEGGVGATVVYFKWTNC
jgi:dsDNA-specific endonuclease/ATPase MutS2